MKNTSILTSACRAICNDDPNHPYQNVFDEMFCKDEIEKYRQLVDKHFPPGTADVFGYRAMYSQVVTKLFMATAVNCPQLYDNALEPELQVVLLGSGMDTLSQSILHSPHRNPLIKVKVFEVDLPETMNKKLETIYKNDFSGEYNYQDHHVRYVTCDFETQDFIGKLEASGFNLKVPALFLWMGVTYYLEKDTVIKTLARLAEAYKDKQHGFMTVAFDYAMETGAATSEAELELAKMGESIKAKFKNLAPTLQSLGYRDIKEVSLQGFIMNEGGKLYEGDARHLGFVEVSFY
jgi:methyltransferase (TIGR00027 family)